LIVIVLIREKAFGSAHSEEFQDIEIKALTNLWVKHVTSQTLREMKLCARTLNNPI